MARIAAWVQRVIGVGHNTFSNTEPHEQWDDAFPNTDDEGAPDTQPSTRGALDYDPDRRS